jgi:predicted phosphodiesterase
MTRLAVLSDIHGNLPALEVVLADIAAQGVVDQVVLAGDVVNWGPFSAAVMNCVTGRDWAIIRGNNEYYLLDYDTPRQPPHWQNYGLLPWLHDQLKGRWQQVIASWPDELTLRFADAPPLRVFHGRPGNPWHGLHPLMTDAQIAALLCDVEETTIIAAHTHLPLNRRVGRHHIINPGSVGVPLDGEFTASYVLLEGDAVGWKPQFRRLPFDLEPLLAEFARTRFVEQYGYEAHLVVEEFKTARLQLHPFIAWWHAQHPQAPVTPDLLATFHRSDKWAYTPPEYHLHRDA